MVIAIEITNKMESKSLPRQTYSVRLLCQPKAGNTAVMRSKADDEFAFDAGITGEACSDYGITSFQPAKAALLMSCSRAH